MNYLQSFIEASESLLANKMRSGLTVLGIIIGVAAVIAVLAIGNGTQASIFHLSADKPELPAFTSFTDVSESTVCVALFGPKAFLVAEKLTNLDFMDPKKQLPFLLQGPFCHVPCQIVTLEKSPDYGGGFLLTCSRGYGDSMLHALLKAGAEFGLRPAGENRFGSWIQGLQG